MILKIKKRKHNKKIINLMNIFNNTYIYFTFPENIYLYKFQSFVNNILFIYYKDYIYKAQLEYSIKKLPIPSPVAFGFKYFNYTEEYDPIQLKFLYVICTKKLKPFLNSMIFGNFFNKII